MEDVFSFHYRFSVGGQPTIVSTIERSATNAGPSAPEGKMWLILRAIHFIWAVA